MIVIADTSPINYLILIGQADLLPRLYEEIVIPEAVLNELNASDTPQSVRDVISQLPKWLKILPTIDLEDALKALSQTNFFASPEIIASIRRSARAHQK